MPLSIWSKSKPDRALLGHGADSAAQQGCLAVHATVRSGLQLSTSSRGFAETSFAADFTQPLRLRQSRQRPPLPGQIDANTDSLITCSPYAMGALPSSKSLKSIPSGA